MGYNDIIINYDFIRRMKRLKELENDRRFCRHDLGHLLDVCRIAYINVLENNLMISKDVIYGAGLLHDIGRVEQYESGVEHDIASAGAAQVILPECGYNDGDIKLICDAILLHRNDKCDSGLGRILYMADKASRCCFNCEARSECNWPENKKNKGVF